MEIHKQAPRELREWEYIWKYINKCLENYVSRTIYGNT